MAFLFGILSGIYATPLKFLINNPQGQAIVERVSGFLKLLLLKQKRGNVTPRARLMKALFSLNYLQLDRNFHSAMLRHFKWTPKVWYRLPDEGTTWKHPVQLLTWGRGYAAVLSQGPVWVPAQLIKPHHELA